jgi:hypothetical protein
MSLDAAIRCPKSQDGPQLADSKAPTRCSPAGSSASNAARSILGGLFRKEKISVNASAIFEGRSKDLLGFRTINRSID